MKKLIHRLILRLTTDDNTQLKKVAADNNTTVSKYVRKVLQDAIWADEEL